MSEILDDYETKERYYATKLFKYIPEIIDFTFTSGRICYDCIIKTVDKTILGEIKIRNFGINKYNTYILEVEKLLGLCKKAHKDKFDRIYYVNFFESEHPNNKDFIIFNLLPRIKEWKINSPKIEQKYMNAKTYISDDYKIIKNVIMLEYRSDIDAKGILTLK